MLKLELGINNIIGMKKIILLISMITLGVSFMNAQCDFYGAISGLSVSGATAGDNTQEYVLVDDAGNIDAIGVTPDFAGLSAGDYQVYAINYEGARPAEIAVNSPWSGTSSISSCFDASLPYNATVCNVVAPCEFTNDISGLSVSGNTAGDNTQEYVLVSAVTGEILVINSTPDFSGLASGNYLIYGINYEGARPAEITVGLLWSGTSSIASCYDATAPYTTNVCEDLCENEDLMVSTTGFNSTGSFSQTYILVNVDDDEVIASNTTGLFSQSLFSANDNLAVYALNTDDATLLTSISVGATWSTIETSINSACADLLGPRSILIISSTTGSCCGTTNRVFIR